ncbi:MAG: tellurite resistance TerB family protein [Gammaproteobacteria bacterium]|nr:tellurite resistance TerB family protein [Gammaproteobacteria bacterium]MDP2141582.1 tellurite resistance TerB family protein [Gammaproteobacteria bacterium]MDP2346662.1 tellurite resistance TerB family protein [Gammaproteobacteria bacterium]
MINPNNLLEQFLGPNAANSMRQVGGNAKQQLDGMGMGGFGGGAVVGGILGLMLGGKKMKKMAKGVVGYGGAAVAGAMAYKAYQNWQQGKAAATAPVATQADIGLMDQSFLPEASPAANGMPFQLVMIQAMIAAAKADGHIDAQEQKVLFEQVEKMGLDAESKAFVFDALTRPVDIAAIASSAKGIEQATELYLISRIAIDVDHPAERAYLQALGHKLNLPADLIAHLDHQVEAAPAQ